MKISIPTTSGVTWVKDPSLPILPKLRIINLGNLLLICIGNLRNFMVGLGLGGRSVGVIRLENSQEKHGLLF